LSAEDVALIRQGKEPKVKITAKSAPPADHVEDDDSLVLNDSHDLEEDAAKEDMLQQPAMEDGASQIEVIELEDSENGDVNEDGVDGGHGENIRVEDLNEGDEHDDEDDASWEIRKSRKRSLSAIEEEERAATRSHAEGARKRVSNGEASELETEEVKFEEDRKPVDLSH